MKDLFKRGSPLFKDFPRYEERPEQQDLAELVRATFEKGEVSLLEAGTGVGKSFAYLVPALLLAHTKGERVVISTHTIHLQEQIIKKDIPFLLKALNLHLGAALAMGLRNYLCLRHLEEFSGEEEKGIYDKLIDWKEQGGSLKKGELPFAIPSDMAESLFADHESCTGQKCPHYEDCAFFNDRKKLEESKIIVANHHLLLSDLELKKQGERGILPPYSYLVIDEAHHLEDVATQLFARSVSNIDLFRLFGRLYSENKRGRKGVLNRLLEKVETYFAREGEPHFLKRFREKILLEYPALREKGMMEIHRLFQKIDHYTPLLETKWRVTPLIKKGDIQTFLQKAEEGASPIPSLLSGLLYELKGLNEEKLLKEVEPLFQEVESLRSEFATSIAFLKEVIGKEEIPTGKVQWFSHEGRGLREELRLGETSIDQREALKTALFQPLKGVALLSATLGGKKDFTPLAERLGLKERGWKEKAFVSPFQFDKQALFLAVDGLPPVDTPEFTEEAKELLLQFFPSSRGGTFLLFTSFLQLFSFRTALEEKIKALGMTPLFQGDLPRRKLIEKFQEERRPILFGTDSFWEGVDIPGNKLKTVVLIKLPFKSPKDPIIEARSEVLKEEGKNPFMSYHLPEALIKFKQGFGRLIRSHSDKGVVVCLDRRLKEKGYGKSFLDALPPCPKQFVSKEALTSTISSFWK